MKKILSMIILTFMLVLSAFGLSACGHEHAYVDTVVAPTCVDKGYTLHKCECGESYTDTEVNALGHDFGDYVSDNNAECEKNCTETAICKIANCGTTDTRDIANTALSHIFTNYVEDNNATYEFDGTKTATCDRDDCEGKDVINNPGDPAKAISVFTYSGNEITGLTTYGKTLTELVIPARINDIEFTRIGEDAFSGCNELTTVTFGENSQLTSIGDWAFYSCSSLQTIEIPASVISIGEVAFRGCSSLKSIELPASVTSIGRGVFSYSASLTSIIVDENNLNYRSIDGNLYSKDGKTLLQYAIGKTATTFTIPEGVTSINELAFRGSSSLQSIEIPASVTSIELSAFHSCSNLATVIFGENSQLTSIGDYAFSSCDSLQSIEIPASVISIGEEAFGGCAFQTIEIPASVSSIGKWAFSSCDKLTSITVEENNQNYKSIDGNLYSKDGKTLLQYPRGKTATTFTIPEGVTSINEFALYLCSSLQTIEIPASVISIGEEAFSGCSSLKSIELPASVTSIGDLAFIGCSNLATVTFGENSQLTRIGDYAFAGCSKLSTVTFGENSQLTSIGAEAFSDCYSLQSIEIPASVTRIGDRAFFFCNLTTIYYGGTASDWENISIEGNKYHLTEATRYYYIENESDLPDDNGNYWHYVDGVPTVWGNN